MVPRAFGRRIRADRDVLAILLLFVGVYGSISFVNHHLFRTYALDLGLYSNAAWKYAHGIVPDRSLFLPNNDVLLADHFDLHLPLWSPLTYLFGQWTLLVVQVSALGLGGLGTFRLALAVLGDRRTAIGLMCCTLGFFGVFTALGFDFHSNVVACMALPWYFSALHRRDRRAAWGWLIFMLVAKENMGLWLFAVALGAMALSWVDNGLRRMVMVQAAVGLAWSLLIVGVVMPALDSGGIYQQTARYAHLGSGWSDMLRNACADPLHFLGHFVDTVDDDQYGPALKYEYYLVLLASGGWALLLRWPVLLMALPLLAQKMLHASPTISGLFAHYSIEFAVLLPLAMMDVFLRLKNLRLRHTLVLVSFGGVVSATIYTLDLPMQHARNDHGEHDRLRFYQARHYTAAHDLDALRVVLRSIPARASVSATSCIVPHLFDRPELHAYPLVNDARYIVLLVGEGAWPLSWEDHQRALADLRSSPDWTLLKDTAGTVLFERRNP